METLLVKVTCSGGISGWGEALAPVLPDVAGRIISELFTPVLLGRDPLDRGVIWNMLYGLMRDRGYYSGFMVDAISAVDCAPCGTSRESISACRCISSWAAHTARRYRPIYPAFR